MPAFYKIDAERRLVVSSASGVFSLADARSHQDRLSQDPDFDPSYSQIADFTYCAEFDLSAEDIRTLAQKPVFSSRSRRALIAPNDLAYGLGRMFAILRENEGETGIRVFRKLEEALDWVFSERTAPIAPADGE